MAAFAASCSGSDFTATVGDAGSSGSNSDSTSGAGGRVVSGAGTGGAKGGEAGHSNGGSHAGNSPLGGAGESEAGASGAAAGAMGTAGEAGAANAGTNSGGNAGNTNGGNAGSAGASTGGGGVNTGGDTNAGSGGANPGGGSNTGGAGASSAGSDSGGNGGGGCTVISWFPDGDDDGFGRSSGEVKACAAPSGGKWVQQGGDCNDDNKAVFPMNPDFFSNGYTTAGNGLSFDYDCSGAEEEDPGARGSAPACGALSSCSGSGFQATGRTGNGVNPLCGSKMIVTCSGNALSCKGVTSIVADGAPCH